MKNHKIRLNRLVIFAYLAFGFVSLPTLAQDTPPSQPSPEMTAQPRVKLQTLDKATARTQTFEAKVGSTLKFGPLYIKVETCQKSSPIARPESAAFIKIWETAPEELSVSMAATKEPEKSEWVFSGWMFASSPALSPMDHPIYDVWLLDCLPEEGQEKPITIPVAPFDPETSEAPTQDPDAVPLD